jgi:hypothetical protein
MATVTAAYAARLELSGTAKRAASPNRPFSLAASTTI